MYEIQELVEQLQQAKDAYYNDDPILSDAEFDALEDQLRELDPDNAYFAGVGTKPTSGWKKVKHEAPMGSLLKAQTKEALTSWAKTVEEPFDLIVSEKLDGISISLKYVEGRFVQAVTRGDGEEGEDITRNVMLMHGFPRKIDGVFSGFVRGEIVLFKETHRKHVPEYKNPRNAAAGIAKRESDPSLCKHLTVLCYRAISDVYEFDNKAHEFEWLLGEGFMIPEWNRLNLAGVLSMYDHYTDERRAKCDYDIDGLVVELNDLQAMEDLGEQDGRPRGARALKFPHEQQPTKLNDIVWQVGPSGRITPVAYFDSVSLAGATVSQASLHNVDNIMRLWSQEHYPKVGDTILVSRRNDVIPFVESVIAKSRGKTTIPTCHECPSCGAAANLEGAYVVCSNKIDCPAQQSGKIKRWVKKLGIKEWGDAMIDALCREYVTDLADIYTLQATTLAKLEVGGKVLGKSTAEKALHNLHEKKVLPLADFVGALGIDLWGQSMCQILVDAGYDTLEKMEEEATFLQLSAVPGVGSKKARAFEVGFGYAAPTIAKLLNAGVEIKAPVIGGVLSGKSFCFTGIRNKELEGRIKDAGGTVKGSVGKGLTYLVAKDPKSTSGKAKKARELGVEVIGIADVEKML